MTEHEYLQRLVVDDTAYQTQVTKKYRQRKLYVRIDPRQLRAIIPGAIRKMTATAGQKVRRGDPLFVLEAMKMQNSVLSPCDGVIKTVAVKIGDRVSKDQILIEFE